MRLFPAVLIGAAAAVGWWLASRPAVAVSDTVAGWGDSLSGAAETVTNTVLEAIGMRGIRNNNPGNIRHSANRWQGMSAQQTDAAFVQFDAPEYGIRALSKLLDTYSNIYGLKTVRGIINKYAPAVENNTSAYASAVAAALGVSPDAQIDVQARKADLVQAIIKHENGIQPYALAVIDTGVTMA